MPTAPTTRRVVGNGYPTTDPSHMSESELHRLLRNALIETLQAYYVDEPLVHVTGDLMLFYEEGNRLRHLAPDLFVAFGVGKHLRDNYLMWEETPPRLVIELTSPSTRDDDLGPKFLLYQDVLRVKEYILFDPRGDLLTPPMQGWRLTRGVYRPIRSLAGRLPSRELGLHLERDGNRAYFWDPDTRRRLLSPTEQIELALDEAEDAREREETENARLRRLLDQAGIHPEGD